MYPDAKVNRDYNVGQIEARIASGDIGDVFHFAEVGNLYICGYSCINAT